MRPVAALVSGYKAFLDDRYPREAMRYRMLTDKGQSPQTMVIACCDSRVDPATIFNARPGDLFIVRNVANLVPPYEPLGDYHGTSAALEFAVTSLEVKDIVVMGHARCGGIRACLDGHFERPDADSFITKWISLLKPARGKVLGAAETCDRGALQQALEHESVRLSLENLRTFPFLREREQAGQLGLHGAYFDIASGDLLALNADSGEFEPLV